MDHETGLFAGTAALVKFPENLRTQKKMVNDSGRMVMDNYAVGSTAPMVKIPSGTGSSL